MKSSDLHTEARIFLISDLHFDHENIIKYCNRPFKSKEEMNNAMISNWNSAVGDSDIVYILGDVTFGRGHLPADYWLGKLNGNKFLIRGNHDKGEILNAKKTENAVLSSTGLKFLLVHEPVRPGNWRDWIIHGDKHNNDLSLYPLVNYENKTVNVCVELTGYAPLLFDDLMAMIKKGKNTASLATRK